MTVDDNDTRGVTVVPNLAQHRCRRERHVYRRADTLSRRASVRITVTENSDDFSVSPSSLSFSSSNWNRPQTVTVRVDSDFDAGDAGTLPM